MRLRRLRSESGQTSVEIIGLLPWFLLAGLVAWQILLSVSTAGTTENAARSGSRAAGRGGDASAAALRSLPGETRRHAEITVNGDRVTVRVRIPILVPGLDTDALHMTRSAELPPT